MTARVAAAAGAVTALLAVAAARPARGAGPHSFGGDPAAPHYPVSPGYRTVHREVRVRLDTARGTLRASETLTLRAVRPQLAGVALAAREIAIERVTQRAAVAVPGTPLAGRASAPATPLAWAPSQDGIVIRLARPLAPGEIVTLAIDYTATPREGLHFSRAANGSVVAWTHGETEENPFWLPGWDEPGDRASSEIEVIVPEGQSAVANGDLVETVPQGDGTVLYHYYQPAPHPLYLDAFVAGPLVEIGAEAADARKTPLVYAAPAGSARDDVARTFVHVPAMVGFFADWLGVPYPYSRYAETLVPRYPGGGMENIGATTLTSRALLDAADDAPPLREEIDGLLSHELFHQWFGDDVTCADWSEIWLNEGAATFGALLWTEHAGGADAAALARQAARDAYFAEDGASYSRPIVDRVYEHSQDLFDATTYSKGGLVLHMLRRLLGDAAFREGLRRYLTAHALGSGTTDDLREAMEGAAGGESLAWFFDQWTRRAGYPTVTMSWSWDAAARAVRLHASESVPGASGPGPFRLPAQVEIVAADGSNSTRPVVIEALDQTLDLASARKPRAVVFDPDHDLVAAETRDGEPDETEWILAHDAHAAARLDAARALATGQTGRTAGAAARLDAARALATAHTGSTAGTVSALAACLRRDRFDGVRAQCARSLASVRGVEAMDALLAGTADPSIRVREAVATSLGAWPAATDPRGAKALARTLTLDTAVTVRAAAAEALGHAGGPEALRILDAALESSAPSYHDAVRAGAARGLGALGDLHALEDLLALVKDDPTLDERTAEAAAGAVADLLAGERHPAGALDDAEERLQVLLGCPLASLRQAAARALGRIGGANARAALSRALPGETSRRGRRSIEHAIQAIDVAEAQIANGTPDELLPGLEQAEREEQSLEDDLEGAPER